MDWKAGRQMRRCNWGRLCRWTWIGRRRRRRCNWGRLCRWTWIGRRRRRTWWPEWVWRRWRWRWLRHERHHVGPLDRSPSGGALAGLLVGKVAESQQSFEAVVDTGVEAGGEQAKVACRHKVEQLLPVQRVRQTEAIIPHAPHAALSIECFVNAGAIDVGRVDELGPVAQLDGVASRTYQVLPRPEWPRLAGLPVGTRLVAHALHHHEPARTRALHEVADVLRSHVPIHIRPPLPPRRQVGLVLQVDGEEVPARAERGGDLAPARVDDGRRHLGRDHALDRGRPVVPEALVELRARALADEHDKDAVIGNPPDDLAQHLDVPAAAQGVKQTHARSRSRSRHDGRRTTVLAKRHAELEERCRTRFSRSRERALAIVPPSGRGRPCRRSGPCIPEVSKLWRSHFEHLAHEKIAQDVLVREADPHRVEAVLPQEAHVHVDRRVGSLSRIEQPGKRPERQGEERRPLVQVVLVVQPAEAEPVGALERERSAVEGQASRRRLKAKPVVAVGGCRAGAEREERRAVGGCGALPAAPTARRARGVARAVLAAAGEVADAVLVGVAEGIAQVGAEEVVCGAVGVEEALGLFIGLKRRFDRHFVASDGDTDAREHSYNAVDRTSTSTMRCSRRRRVAVLRR
eukprot:4059619-Prymnesium_polylepis.1